LIQALGAALSAINGFARKLAVSANNIANVDTDGFKKSRTILTEGTPSGVIASVERVETPGMPIPSPDGSPEARESSNVSLEEEIIEIKIAKHGYDANLKAMKAQDETLGSYFDTLG
jgi:flagellar basal body rod protein FlgG